MRNVSGRFDSGDRVHLWRLDHSWREKRSGKEQGYNKSRTALHGAGNGDIGGVSDSENPQTRFHQAE